MARSNPPFCGLVDHSLAKPTRIYRLPDSEGNNLWIKREDELSAGISGSKLRKYASLIPYLKENRIEAVAMIGGPNSNNLVGLAQLLKENAIKPIAFIREAADQQLRGNALLLDMLLSRDEIQVIPRDRWQLAEKIAQKHLSSPDFEKVNTHLLQEGCFGIEALPGAMTLAQDIIRNEQESKQTFERIYVDCGTGLGAIGLILGLESLPNIQAKKREVVVTLIAEDEKGFSEKLQQMRAVAFQKPESKTSNLVCVRFLEPHLSPKFGSINKSLFSECREIAKNTGIIMDPTYSVKHYNAAKKDLARNPNQAASLFIFNGSALGVLGFQDKLAVSDNSRLPPRVINHSRNKGKHASD